jgi:hypothetical protein
MLLFYQKIKVDARNVIKFRYFYQGQDDSSIPLKFRTIYTGSSKHPLKSPSVLSMISDMTREI